MTAIARLFAIAICLGVIGGGTLFLYEYHTCGYKGCSTINLNAS